MGKHLTIPEASSQSPPVFGIDAPWLAPLAGYSDLPFRMLCRHYGAAVCMTEMISARGLVYGNPATARLLKNVPRDSPLVVQLFGGDPASMAGAVRQLAESGYYYFDCNMGCSVRKVMRQNAGAALLGDPATALAVARKMIEALKSINPAGMIGFKLRCGLAPDAPVLPDLALRLEDAGASWLTLHPRYANQGFGGQADWDLLAMLAPRLGIPLLASGDLFTGEAGVVCLRQTGADGLMYARGALKNPAIFQNHQNALAGMPEPDFSPLALRELIERHLRLVEEYGDRQAVLLRMRSLAPRYAHSLPGVTELRRSLCACQSWEQLQAALDQFIKANRVEQS